MLVSYVLTAYNIENFIEESIQCAFNQTYEPLEIILSDDCSTDRTYEIMERMANEYKGPHKIVLNRNPENLGITKHMNKAYLELATGEIIIAAHGDDISLPERTEKLVNYLEEDSSCTQVSCGAICCDSDLNPLSEYYQKNFSVSEKRMYSLATGGKLSVGFTAFRRSVMTLFGPLNDDCPTEDDPIGFRMLLSGNLCFLPDIMIKYRKHSTSSSNPENFDKFPLEKILKQQNDDMIKAVSMGLITENQRLEIHKTLEKNMYIRKKYRVYFANRNLKSLIPLVMHKGLSLRGRLGYIKDYLLYLKEKLK